MSAKDARPKNDEPTGKVRVAITLGDPAGIGPEIVLAALDDAALHELCTPVVVGDPALLARCAAQLGRTLPAFVPWQGDGPLPVEGVALVPVTVSGSERIEPGVASPAGGRAADAYLRRACELGLQGRIEAIATAPLHKGSLRLAGVDEIGHTELLARYLGGTPLTLFICERMRIFFLSRHLSLREAIEYIDAERVGELLSAVHGELQRLGLARARIAVAALNPHAGDDGQFGDEEELHLRPAIEAARARGIDAHGPVPADAVFHQALCGAWDCVIALYHDQGHIASKTRDFHGTITATLGLPVPRTSVDHGTAFDIAWQGKAEARSMIAAVAAAARLAQGRWRDL